MKGTLTHPAAQVLGVEVDAINMDTALARIAAFLKDSQKGYICVANVHGVMEAQRSRQLSEVYAASAATIPDGMPLVWVGRLQGHSQIQRVTGPDLMLEVVRGKEFAGVTHFLYGGVEGVAQELRDKLTKQYPWVQIVGARTPPFQKLSPAEERDLVETIGELKPDIIWIGIGCPQQELFLARYLPLLDTKLMFGVGAAFDYHTGRIRDCDDWVKRAGLQWLHRLMQNPRRLWRRYLRTNPAFIWHIAMQLTGLQRYPPNPTSDVGEEPRRVELNP